MKGNDWARMSVRFDRFQATSSPLRLGRSNRPSHARVWQQAKIEGLWRIYDEGSETQREMLAAVAEECFVYLQASRDHQVLLSPERVADLKSLLEATGTDPSMVYSEDHAGGLLRVEVARAKGSGARLGLALQRVLATVSIVKHLARAAVEDATIAHASST